MTARLVPPLLAAAAASLAVAAAATRADRRVRWRLTVLAGPRPSPRRGARLADAPDHVALRLISRTGRAANARREAVERHVLEFVELLVAGTEAGLPPAAAVQRSAPLVRGPLGEELKRAGRDIALGLDWRAALEDVSARTGAANLRKLMTALGRAHRLGTSAQASLRGIADELRSQQRVRAEEAARRAPVKMLFPLVFLILPAFLLLTVGPVLLATIRSLH